MKRVLFVISILGVLSRMANAQEAFELPKPQAKPQPVEPVQVEPAKVEIPKPVLVKPEPTKSKGEPPVQTPKEVEARAPRVVKTTNASSAQTGDQLVGKATIIKVSDGSATEQTEDGQIIVLTPRPQGSHPGRVSLFLLEANIRVASRRGGVLYIETPEESADRTPYKARSGVDKALGKTQGFLDGLQKIIPKG